MLPVWRLPGRRSDALIIPTPGDDGKGWNCEVDTFHFIRKSIFYKARARSRRNHTKNIVKQMLTMALKTRKEEK